MGLPQRRQVVGRQVMSALFPGFPPQGTSHLAWPFMPTDIAGARSAPNPPRLPSPQSTPSWSGPRRRRPTSPPSPPWSRPRRGEGAQPLRLLVSPPLCLLLRGPHGNDARADWGQAKWVLWSCWGGGHTFCPNLDVGSLSSHLVGFRAKLTTEAEGKERIRLCPPIWVTLPKIDPPPNKTPENIDPPPWVN